MSERSFALSSGVDLEGVDIAFRALTVVSNDRHPGFVQAVDEIFHRAAYSTGFGHFPESGFRESAVLGQSCQHGAFEVLRFERKMEVGSVFDAHGDTRGKFLTGFLSRACAS